MMSYLKNPIDFLVQYFSSCKKTWSISSAHLIFNENCIVKKLNYLLFLLLIFSEL